MSGAAGSKLGACVLLISMVAALSLPVAPASSEQPASRQLTMSIQVIEPRVCRLSFEGQSFDLPREAQRMESALREGRGRRRIVAVLSDETTPYQCIGHAVYLAQRAGYRKVQANIPRTP